jgi:hypothetical protein
MLIRLLVSCLLVISLFSISYADEIRIGLSDQTAISVTIYNQDTALVKDRRKVTLAKGENRLAFREVSARMRPETALMRSVSHPDGFFLIEQNFDFDLLTPQKMLEKYVGRKVGVVRTNPATGMDSEEDAEVLSTNSGVVLKMSDGSIETGLPARFVFKDVPENLRDRPTLVTVLTSATGEPQELELSYLTGGLSWRADYVAELDPKDEKVVLNGWVTLTNASGTTYKNSNLQLVAGDIHFAPPEGIQGMYEDRALAKAAGAPRMAEEGLFEYHLYSLDRPTTIADNQTKQVALLSASAVPVKKELVLEGGNYYYRGSYGNISTKLKVGVFVEFDNKEASGLGMPLPKGVIRVYKQDSKGRVQFIGEDRIDHTPKNEKVRLKLGEAFDVTAEMKQTDFRKVGGNAFESAYEITLKNAKTEAVTVTVQQPIGGDWTMLSENFPHEKGNAFTAVWKIKVPAGGSEVLKYRVRVR